ncbi:ATP-binding cassette domain-containing protein [Schumannella luteola]|uniref:Peptide/nickel transport system ATP-binding protein n=1 Tax=Schumannella luteola TaxID=472059 RepID=A0A852YDG9_9MICO|nr:ATP-binding cassette domain-containing protein [Schumannella luteola]NYG97687.1 peptide/nickel transport system ATP-binding protein [Schumannella luteola]TPX01442.1 ABC transporter ATP-binding protein [Schumannella luteola]
MSAAQPLLTVDQLEVAYPGRGFRAKPARILKGVSIEIGAGRTLGLVGESGSGKTTLGRALLGLAPVTGGRITFDGKDATHVSRAERKRLSRDMQVVFQDPYTSLNPAMEVGAILAEPLVVQGIGGVDAKKRIAELLDQVGLPSDSIHRLPREFSGGQRQRVAIARALALRPKLIVCDEPVSALDLSTQARVLDLFLAIQQETGVSYLFISHDLDVVRHISHEVSVLFRGDIVEHGPAEQVTRDPQHPYTKRLLLASPVPDPDRQAVRRRERRELIDAEAAEAAEAADAAGSAGASAESSTGAGAATADARPSESERSDALRG